MSIEQKATELFLEQFMLHPTIAEMERFVCKPHEHFNMQTARQFNTERLMREHFMPLLVEYFGWQGSSLPSEVAVHFVRAAEIFAQQGFGHCAWAEDNPAAAVQHTRLSCLMRHPVFVADRSFLPFMLALKDIRSCEPWGFEMWMDNDRSRGRVLLPGFGPQHIDAIDRLLSSEELWSGTNRELHRVFLACLGKALRRFAQDQALFLATVWPRIKVMLRNRDENGLERHHEPTCKAEFWPPEIEMIRQAGRTDEDMDAAVAVIDREGMSGYPHAC